MSLEPNFLLQEILLLLIVTAVIIAGCLFTLRPKIYRFLARRSAKSDAKIAAEFFDSAETISLMIAAWIYSILFAVGLICLLTVILYMHS